MNAVLRELEYLLPSKGESESDGGSDAGSDADSEVPVDGNSRSKSKRKKVKKIAPSLFHSSSSLVSIWFTYVSSFES